MPVPGQELGSWVPASRDALDACCGLLSWALPLAVGLWSLSGEAGFRDDLGVVRDLGFARVDSQGVISTLLTRPLAWLPLGGGALRASLLGVLALALASRCSYGLLRAALDRRGVSAIHPVFAWIGTSLWALGPGAQSEAMRIGGALPAVALVILGSSLGRVAFERAEAAALAGTGLALGATLAESHAAGFCLALALASAAAVEPSRTWTERAWRLIGSALAAFVILGALRWVGPASASDLTMVAGASPLPPSLVPPRGLGLLELAARTGAHLAGELGGPALVLAAAGAVITASVQRLRSLAAWALPLAFAAGAPIASGAGPEAAPTFMLLASLGVMAFVPVALHELVRWVWRSPLPFARHAALLTLTFATTLVLSRLDRALLDQTPSTRAAAAWTDEALGNLPRDSVLVVHSPALAFRLLASRTLNDTRPDVVVLPAGPLTQSSLTRDTTRAAPSTAPLLRQLWVNGVADEYSLSHLADERPVFTELDPAWDRRLLEHLRPEGLWLRYSAPALGASDRRKAAASGRLALRRVLANLAVARSGAASVGPGRVLDRDTRRALGDAIARQALSFAVLAERDVARRVLRAARRIDPGNPLASGLAAHLAEPARGRVAAADLLE
jgi:hypothetical protein